LQKNCKYLVKENINISKRKQLLFKKITTGISTQKKERSIGHCSALKNGVFAKKWRFVCLTIFCGRW
jgi:hypothetical protein